MLVIVLAGIFPVYAKSNFVRANLEIEKTFHLGRKKQRTKEQRREERRNPSSMARRGGDQRRTLRDFVTPRVQGIASSTARPTVDANNFELKPALISIVQQS